MYQCMAMRVDEFYANIDQSCTKTTTDAKRHLTLHTCCEQSKLLYIAWRQKLNFDFERWHLIVCSGDVVL